MAIRNDNIELSWKKLFIPFNSFTGVGVILPDPIVDGDPAALASASTGAPLVTEVSSYGVCGLQVEADSDEARTLITLPGDLDANEEVYVRCHWTTQSSTTTDTFDCTVKYRQYAAGAVLNAASFSTLDVAIPTDTVTGAGQYHVTSAGTIYAGSLDPDTNVAFEIQAIFARNGGHSEAIHFLGLEFLYMPKLTPGAQKAKVAKPDGFVIAD